MNSEELKNKLEELNVPGRYYSINSSISSDRYVFRQVHIYWECFILMKEEDRMIIIDLIMKMMHVSIS